MHFGVAIFPTDYTISPPDLARAVEDRGFESLFVCEHSHQPLSTQEETGRPGSPTFSRTLDPFVALTAAAMVTQSIKLGTAVCLVTERDPIHLAKEAASLDLLSAGRLVLGVGAGWNVPEMRNHGTEPGDRWKVLGERVKAVRTIWTNDVAEFHGSFVDFSPMESWPKPLQHPHPPIVVGGVGPRALQRVIDFGDGWFPYGLPPAQLAPRIADLRQRGAEAGRGGIQISVFGSPTDPATLAAYRDLGIDRVVLLLPDGSADEVLKSLDDYSSLVG